MHILHYAVANCQQIQTNWKRAEEDDPPNAHTLAHTHTHTHTDLQ